MPKIIRIILLALLVYLMAGCSMSAEVNSDPCHWKERTTPIRTPISGGYRVDIAPKLDQKKIVFEGGQLESVRVEVTPERYLQLLDAEIDEVEHDVNFYEGNHATKLLNNSKKYLKALQASRQMVETQLQRQKEFDASAALGPESQYAGLVSAWLSNEIEQGNAAIYDLNTGECVPYITVSEWSEECGDTCGSFGREFYLPEGTPFLMTFDGVY